MENNCKCTSNERKFLDLFKRRNFITKDGRIVLESDICWNQLLYPEDYPGVKFEELVSERKDILTRLPII